MQASRVCNLYRNLKRKGVTYDTGRHMGFNWRRNYDPAIVHRELEIIRDDLHCNAIRVCGLDIERLLVTAEDALHLNLEVWLSPEMWDKAPEQTLSYLTKAAARAEGLRSQYPEKVVFSVGPELTLFMQGIIPGKTFGARIKNPDLMNLVKSGEHNKSLNDFLSKASSSVREVFHGKVTYASLVWESVDWSLFDFVGVDHYRIKNIEDKYVEFLKPSFLHGKPVVITEFGYGTGEGGIGSQGFLSTSGLSGGIIDLKSQFLHYGVPLLGRFIKPKVVGNPVRNEAWQATKLVENLKILDDAGVDGAFIFQFISQITPHSEDPSHDLDIASSSLVKYYEDGRLGTSYADMPWEPKESFRAVAEYFASHY